MKFWDAAEENGMVHHDYWDSEEVERWTGTARALVDPSWSRKYSAIGGHWNRVVVDAMIGGAIPVARPLGMGDELFKAGEHYVAIPTDVGPQEYADIVLSVGGMSDQEANRFRGAHLDLLHKFDRKEVAKRLLDLVNGELDNTEIRHGETDPQIKAKFEDLMFNFYGVLA